MTYDFKLVVELFHPQIGETFTKVCDGETIEDVYRNMSSDLRMYLDTEAEYGISFSYYAGYDYLQVTRASLYKRPHGGEWIPAPEYLGKLYAYHQDDCSGGWCTTTYWDDEEEGG